MTLISFFCSFPPILAFDFQERERKGSILAYLGQGPRSCWIKESLLKSNVVRGMRDILVRCSDRKLIGGEAKGILFSSASQGGSLLVVILLRCWLVTLYQSVNNEQDDT